MIASHTPWLLVWGVVVGLDLTTVAQVMVTRPLVAGTIAGAIAGDIIAGLTVGAILELFALDYLPVGASRYPDYGVGAVVAAAAAAGAPSVLGTGLAVAIGLLVAYAGEQSITFVRRLNTADVRRQVAGLDAGDPRALRGVHRRSFGRDVARALFLTAAGLALAAVARDWPPVSLRGAVLLTAVLVGVALASGVLGARRLAGRGVVWFVAGLAGGIVWVLR